MLLKSGLIVTASVAALLVGVPVGALAQTAPAAVTDAAESSSIIVGQAELVGLLGNSGVKIIDVRSSKDYAKSHLPGAISLPWYDLSESEIDGVRNEFAADDVLAKKFGEAGLSYNDTIVIYDVGTLAGRAYVTFEYAGFPNIRVLDGGFGKWSGETSTTPVKPTPIQFVLSRKRENRVDQKFVEARVKTQDALILDGRSVQAYEDGHIPSAKALPQDFYLDQNALRKSKKELLASLAAKGISTKQRIVSYCGSGVAAANAYLALKDLGFEDIVLYDGSWDEWSRDPRAGQEVALPNYSITHASLKTESLPGLQILDESEVKKAQTSGKAIVVDVRSPSDFGAGKIPGSVNVYWNDTLDADRVLKSAKELQKLYEEQGVTADKQVIVFTRGGLQLSHSFTVLKLLGYPNVAAFTGKFEGWDNASFRAR